MRMMNEFEAQVLSDLNGASSATNRIGSGPKAFWRLRALSLR